eukprot:1602689-Pyramimonas_sp.AAC.1
MARRTCSAARACPCQPAGRSTARRTAAARPAIDAASRATATAAPLARADAGDPARPGRAP